MQSYVNTFVGVQTLLTKYNMTFTDLMMQEKYTHI